MRRRRSASSEAIAGVVRPPLGAVFLAAAVPAMTRSCRLARRRRFAGVGRFTRPAHWSPIDAPGFSRDIRPEFVKNWYLFVGLSAASLIIVSKGLFPAATAGAQLRMLELSRAHQRKLKSRAPACPPGGPPLNQRAIPPIRRGSCPTARAGRFHGPPVHLSYAW